MAHKDVDHLMIYDALRASAAVRTRRPLGFMPHEETGQFIADGNTRPGGKLPLNTNGGGLSYMHSGMYGMYALQESVRQMRGIAPAQVPECQDFGVSRRRRHVRGERARSCFTNER
ncbi:thiolase C-terminal domain-containing protein [Bradyrhizobium betae]